MGTVVGLAEIRSVDCSRKDWAVARYGIVWYWPWNDIPAPCVSAPHVCLRVMLRDNCVTGAGGTPDIKGHHWDI